MKVKLFNYKKLKENEINDKVIRVKALIINSKKEILMARAFGTFQFPGGHIEPNESLSEALIREIKEETGIILKGEYDPKYAIKYYLKDFPVRGNNRSIEIYYFCIFTNERYNLNNINLDDQERKGDFKLEYINLKKLKQILKRNKKVVPINKIVNREIMLAIKNIL